MIKSMGCPKCNSNASKGESEIARLLKKWKIPFSTEVTFPGLVGKTKNAPLRFDFCINEGKTPLLIEFDGPQHFDEWKLYSDYVEQ